jgi:hypothetical protein
MPLTDGEKQRFLQWLRQKGGPNTSCPVCERSDRWGPGDVVASPEITTKGEIQFDMASLVPVVQLICHNCGYVRFFNANIVGLGGEQGATRGT